MTHWMRCGVGVLLFLPLHPNSDSSVLHWTTRLGHTNCDNRPVPELHRPELLSRPEQADLQSPLQFEAERSFASGSVVMLVVCNGEIHVLRNTDPAKFKIAVHLGTPLGHERTPKNYLQEFSFGPNHADVEWKLPERCHPVIDIYVPANTDLNLQLGNTNLEIRGVRGNKLLNMGKGVAKLYVANGNSEYRFIDVDVAMGSFADLRPGGRQAHHIPLHEEFHGAGKATAHLELAMGKIEIAAE